MAHSPFPQPKASSPNPRPNSFHAGPAASSPRLGPARSHSLPFPLSVRSLSPAARTVRLTISPSRARPTFSLKRRSSPPSARAPLSDRQPGPTCQHLPLPPLHRPRNASRDPGRGSRRHSLGMPAPRSPAPSLNAPAPSLRPCLAISAAQNPSAIAPALLHHPKLPAPPHRSSAAAIRRCRCRSGRAAPSPSTARSHCVEPQGPEAPRRPPPDSSTTAARLHHRSTTPTSLHGRPAQFRAPVRISPVPSTLRTCFLGTWPTSAAGLRTPASSAAPSCPHRRAPLPVPRSAPPRAPVAYTCHGGAPRPNTGPNKPPECRIAQRRRSPAAENARRRAAPPPHAPKRPDPSDRCPAVTIRTRAQQI